MPPESSAPLFRIVLTGGPCGGKTTALTHISERLRSLGFRVYLVPEVPTILITGGASFHGITIEQLVRMEGNLVHLQMAHEDAFVDIARSTGEPSVVICDRGVMDVSAYLPRHTWQALLDENGWNVVGLRDRRYDAVLHLVTAADGAEAFYTTANNTARTETPEEARALDAKVRDAWVGHPHLRVIGNAEEFADKIRRVLEALCRIVGVPLPTEIERKFLLRRAPDESAITVKHEEFEIEQTYLITTDGSEARVRRRGQAGSFTYTHTVKQPLVAGQRIEVERPISGREYLAFLSQAAPDRRTVRKRRRVFLWKSHYFEIDTFIEPRSGLAVLEAELDDAKQELSLPPFVEVEREVTGEKEYSNFALAAVAVVAT